MSCSVCGLLCPPYISNGLFNVHVHTPSTPLSMSTHAPTKNVVVLGAGSAGVAVAQTLSKKLDHAQYNLILVDTRPHMIWLPAGARTVVTHDETFKDTVRFSPLAVFHQKSGTTFVLQVVFPYDKVLPPGKGTFKQGKVVKINEAKDQPGGELTFEEGEPLSYEGGSPPPRTSTRFVRLKSIQSSLCVLVHGGLGRLISRARGMSSTSLWGNGVASSRRLRKYSLLVPALWDWVSHRTPSPFFRSPLFKNCQGN